MQHIPLLISDLAVILICAGLVTILFKCLKQPVVLGYIVAGMLAGPSCDVVSTVSDTESIRTWAEIGVIFLMFTLGLDFSFKKLAKVGGTAITATITIVMGMMTLGYLTGIMLGWGHMNSIFLGGMISISSTTIIFKAFNDMGLRKHRFASIVLGILVVEDLFAIVLMVVLSTLAGSKHIEGGDLVNSILNLTAFLLFWFVIGIYILPSLLKRWRKHLNDETLLIVSLGLCLGLVVVAVKAGFSAALGAFVMGSILAETIEAERIERVVRPVKDLFGAIFFVSVGMLIEPALLWEYKMPIIVLTLAVMVGQLFFSTFGILLAGQPLKIAIQSSFSLLQIGEFAFIIASLGIALGVIDPFLYPIVVAVSVVTTFFTPYMIRLSKPVYRYTVVKLPFKWQKIIECYSLSSNTTSQRSTWHNLLRGLFQDIVIYMSICVVLAYAWMTVVDPFIGSNISGIWGDVLSLILISLIISPMIRAIVIKKNRSVEFNELWQNGGYNRSALVALIVMRFVLAVGVIVWLISDLLHIEIGVGTVITSISIVLVVFSKHFKIPIHMERKFLKNLAAREVYREQRASVTKLFADNLLEQNFHLAEFEVSEYSPWVGREIKDLNLRKEYNVNIVTISRGERRINIPKKDECIYPFDKLVVVGTDNDLLNFTQDIKEHSNSKKLNRKRPSVNLEKFQLKEGSELIGLSIVQSKIQLNSQCLVIGIERGDVSIKNMTPDTIFELNDVVWIVGECEKILDISNGYRNNLD